jgi:hypothetical protein
MKKRLRNTGLGHVSIVQTDSKTEFNYFRDDGDEEDDDNDDELW